MKNRIDKELIKKLRFESHLSYAAIGKKLGCSRQYAAYVATDKQSRLTDNEKERRRQYQEKYRNTHRIEIIERSKKWYQKHKKLNEKEFKEKREQ